MEWLFMDPRDNDGRRTRVLGLNGDGTLAKLTYYRAGKSNTVSIIYVEDCGENKSGALWTGSMFTKKLSPDEAMSFGKSEILKNEKIAITIKTGIRKKKEI